MTQAPTPSTASHHFARHSKGGDSRHPLTVSSSGSPWKAAGLGAITSSLASEPAFRLFDRAGAVDGLRGRNDRQPHPLVKLGVGHVTQRGQCGRPFPGVFPIVENESPNCVFCVWHGVVSNHGHLLHGNACRDPLAKGRMTSARRGGSPGASRRNSVGDCASAPPLTWRARMTWSLSPPMPICRGKRPSPGGRGATSWMTATGSRRGISKRRNESRGPMPLVVGVGLWFASAQVGISRPDTPPRSGAGPCRRTSPAPAG